ncbi:MAG: efflux RND transporter permease subunit, partial [Thermodesulfovibrionales bacterium]
MWLAETSIKRPVFCTMVISAIVLLGIVSYPSIGVDLFPKVDFPIINVTTTLKGASPEIMDIDVTDKIEEAINTINGVKTIQSTSIEGSSTVTVEFVLEKDINIAAQDIREKISLIRGKLPRDIDEPIIEKVDPDATPVLWLALTGDTKTVRELSTFADEVVKEQLQKINGVGSIRVAGLRLRQIRVWLDGEKMRAYGITAQDVTRALSRENVELPGGRIESKTKEYTLKIKGEITDPQEFNNLIVGYNRGSAIRLKDIGKVEDGMEEKRTIARFNGKPAIGMGIQKQSGTNTVEVIDRVKKELVNIKKTLPPGMSLDISFDQSVFIKRSISEVQHHLVYGGFFASIAVLVFLKSLRITIISALAIPTSIISTFAIMYFFGFTFNNMTMLALSLSIGILIDDAIIVIENIHRHIHEGLKPMEAAAFATKEIGLAVVATTLAIVAIFLPVAFMKGLVGRFFVQFAFTVVFAVLVSMFVSFTLTPMMASRFLKREKGDSQEQKRSLTKKLGDKIDYWYSKIEDVYKKLLEYALQHRLKIMAIAIVLFVMSMFMTKLLGKEFTPSEDQSRVAVRLQAPVDYSIDEIDAMFKKAEDEIRKLPEVQTVFYAQGFFGSVNKGNMFVGFKPKKDRKKSQEQLKAEIRKMLRDKVPGLKASVEDISFLGGGIRNVPIQYVIRGRDLQALERYMNQITAEFSKLPGIVDIDSSVEAGKPEVKV